MASRHPLIRDASGRFARPPAPIAAVVPVLAAPPPKPDPVRFPTEEHPRWRLRVFDRCWPWRATRGEALSDAVASRNARRDVEDRVVYLDATANVQRDPPDAITRGYRLLRAAERRGGGQ